MLLWDDFRLVKAVADARSLAGAAHVLGVNTSTVFRRLGALEDRLSARLFERGRGGYALTPAGEEMVGLAMRMADDVTAFERRIAGRDLKPSGDLRVTTNDTMVVHGLMPILARFRAAYPDIRLELITGNRALNLSRRDADIAIRATAAPPETLVGRRIASIMWAVYAPVDDPIEEGADLSGLPWVGLTDELARNEAVLWMEEATGIPAVLRLNTVLGLADAVAAGIGLGALPAFIGDAHPGLKLLRRPFTNSRIGLWILTHADLRGSARVRAFLDFVCAELARMRPLIEGTGEPMQRSA